MRMELNVIQRQDPVLVLPGSWVLAVGWRVNLVIGEKTVTGYVTVAMVRAVT